MLTILFAVSSCTSCSDSKKNHSKGDINPMVEELDTTPDSALIVRLDDITADSLYVMPRKTGIPTAYAYADAKAQGKIKGSLTKGNLYSIFPDSKTKNVLIAINTTEMSGQWFYDQNEHRGFRFEERGALSSINAKTISFREWKLLNGQLYIYYVDMQQAADDRHEYEVEEADILSLTKDELTLQFRGATLHCKRQTAPIKFKF